MLLNSGSGIDTLVRKWRVCSVVCFSNVWIASDLALLSKSFLALYGVVAWPCCTSQAPSCEELLAMPVAAPCTPLAPPHSPAHLSPSCRLCLSSAVQRLETKGGHWVTQVAKPGLFIKTYLSIRKYLYKHSNTA